MIALRPFRAWRPAPDKAHLVGSRSYVSYTPAQLSEKLAGNPYTFLHVVHPEGTGERQAVPRRERFDAVRRAFKRFCDERILVRDERPAIHLYAQTSRGNTTVGIIAGVAVADYLEGRIKVHEQTLTAREEIFAEYLGSTGINAEPVLLASAPGIAWDSLLDPVTVTRPDMDFSTPDRVRHRLWSISDERTVRALQRAFGAMDALYIADGHHRLASSARLATNTGATDVDPLAWCLAYIVPHRQLYIYNFDRTITTLNGLSEVAFLDALAGVGTLTAVPSPQAAPGVIAVRTTSGWNRLELPPASLDEDPAEQLDAARLTSLVLAPFLGITDLRTDPRVGFVPGTTGTVELDRAVDSGAAAVAFHLHPVTFEELRAVADSGGTMPPKSTWIEPKLRSGLSVYSLEDV